MSNVKVKPFSTRVARLTPLAAAVSLALYGTAHAATVTPNQLPGKGNVVNTPTIPSAGVAGSTFNDVAGTASIDMNNGNTVIKWGLGTQLNPAGIGGFNVGSAANVDFTNGAAGGANVLNIDVSGNLSQILGTLRSSDGNVNLAVANGNGILVGAGATITAPAVEFIGANVGPGQQSDFALGNPMLYNFTGPVDLTVGGNFTGTGYLLVAGAGTVNVTLTQGMQPNTIDVTGGFAFSKNPFNPFNLAAPGQAAVPSVVTLNLLQAGGVPYDPSVGGALYAMSYGDIVIGAPSVVGGAFVGTWEWTGNLINNGTINSSIGGILNPGVTGTVTQFLDTDGATPLLFGGLVNNGSLTDQSGVGAYALPGSIVNTGSLFYGNSVATINAGQDFDNSGSFLPLGVGVLGVVAAGNDFTNTGTLRSQTPATTTLTAGNDFSNTGALEVPGHLEVQAGNDALLGGTVDYFNPGAGPLHLYATAGGDLTYAASTAFGLNTWLYRAELVAGVNPFTGAINGGTLTINAPLTVEADTINGDDYIYLVGQDVLINQSVSVVMADPARTGLLPTQVEINQVSINNYGPLGAVGTVQLAAGASVSGSSVTFNNPSLFGVPGSAAAPGEGGNIPVAYTLNGTVSALDSDGAGGPGASVVFGSGGSAVTQIFGSATSGKPGMITANNLTINNLTGDATTQTNVNSANGDWMANAINVTTTGPNPLITFTANGVGQQKVKFNVVGDAAFSSGGTNAVNVLGMVHIPTPNAGSVFMAQTTGDLTVTNLGAGTGISAPLFGGPGFFFPGVVNFRAGGTLTIASTVDNAYTDQPMTFGRTDILQGSGQWFDASSIVIAPGLGGLFYLNGTSWANFSTPPVGGAAFYGATTHFSDALGIYTIIANPTADPSKEHIRPIPF